MAALRGGFAGTQARYPRSNLWQDGKKRHPTPGGKPALPEDRRLVFQEVRRVNLAVSCHFTVAKSRTPFDRVRFALKDPLAIAELPQTRSLSETLAPNLSNLRQRFHLAKAETCPDEADHL